VVVAGMRVLHAFAQEYVFDIPVHRDARPSLKREKETGIKGLRDRDKGKRDKGKKD
jgi:hypothetical protein